jgi:flagellar hook-associated protein 1 FlgK
MPILGNSIGKLFESFQQVSSEPGNLAGRIVALEQAKQLSDTFVQLSSLLNEMKAGQVTQADYLLDEVNLLTNELDRINNQLATGSQLKVNNALLDARDLLIDKINEYVEVHTELDQRGPCQTDAWGWGKWAYASVHRRRSEVRCDRGARQDWSCSGAGR